MNSKEQDLVGLAAISRRRIRRRVSIATFVAISAMAGAASAQTVNLAPVQPVVRNPPLERALFPWDISRADCLRKGTFTFNLQFNQWTSMQTFEVWGTTQAADCSQLMQRTSVAVPPPCIKLNAAGPSPGILAGSVELEAAEILALANKDPASVEECGAGKFNIAPVPVRLFFMLLDGSGAPIDFAEWPGAMTAMNIDLWGPQAPPKVTVTSGDGSLTVTPTRPEGENLDQFAVYCATSGRVVGPGASNGDSDSGGCSWSVDASGIAGDGGEGGGGGSAGAAGSGGGAGTGGSGGSGGGADVCPYPGFVSADGQPKVPDASWDPCATDSSVPNLENGVTYSIAVAYKDQLGNVGALSEVECAAPAPIDDFFEAYRESGGAGGGGFCSMSPRARKVTSFGASFALAALAFVVRRKSRRERSAALKEESK